MLQDSVLSPFIQMADLVAVAARLAIAQKTPEQAWYTDHLLHPADPMGRTIDVSKRPLRAAPKVPRRRLRQRVERCDPRPVGRLLLPLAPRCGTWFVSRAGFSLKTFDVQAFCSVVGHGSVDALSDKDYTATGSPLESRTSTRTFRVAGPIGWGVVLIAISSSRGSSASLPLPASSLRPSLG